MSLVDTPVELLQDIFKLCATSDYLQLIRTCRKLHAIGTCHWVVSHHLGQVPDFELASLENLDSLPVTALYKELRKRSASYLLGANIHSETTLHALRDATIDPRGSTIFKTNRVADGSEMPSVAIVPRDGDFVRLYCMHIGSVPSMFTLHGILNFPYEHPGKVEILHVVPCHFDEKMIYVLQRYEPRNRENHHQAQQSMNTEKEEEEEEIRTFFEPGIHLVQYRWSRSVGIWAVTSISRFPGWESGYHPLAMEPLDQNVVAISWIHPTDDENCCLFLHRPDGWIIETDKCKYIKYLSCEMSTERKLWRFPSTQIETRLRGSGCSRSPPVFGMYFEYDKFQLAYSNTSPPIHDAYQWFWLDAPRYEFQAERIRCDLPIARYYNGMGSLDAYKVDAPFYTTHQANVEPTNTRPHCGWSRLAFGINYHSIDAKQADTAYLLRSNVCCRSDGFGNLDHSHAEAYLPEWIVTAELLGYDENDRHPTRSISYSRLGTRLAVSSQRRVYIWPLEPNEILTLNVNGYYPPAMRRHTDTWDEQLSYDWYKSRGDGDEYQHERSVVALKPIIIELEEDCYAMRFLDGENELLVLTGAGLVVWRLDAFGSGERTSVLI